MWNGTNTVFWEERANPFTWIKWTTPSTASWNSFMLCFTHELFVWRRLKWVSVHIARSSAYMVSTTFPFTAVTDSGASFSIRYETVSTPVETLTFLMEAKARLSSVQVSGGVNRQTVIWHRVREGSLHLSSELLPVRRENRCHWPRRKLSRARPLCSGPSCTLCCRVAGQNQEQRTVALFF